MEAQSKEIRIENYTFRAAASPAERLAALRLRSLVYIEEGFVEPEDLDGELLQDGFDQQSVMLVALDPEARVVGTTRYVLPGRLGLPIDRLFDIEDPLLAKGAMGEFSRLAIDRLHRGGSRVVMLGLIAAVAQCAKEHGTDHFLAFLPVRLIEYFSSMGFYGRIPAFRPPNAQILRNRHLLRGYFAKAEVHPILYSRRATEDRLRVLLAERHEDLLASRARLESPAEGAERR